MLKKLRGQVKRFLQSEDGPTAVEYAIMLALIVAVCFVAIQSVGTQTSSMYDNIADEMDQVRQAGAGGL